MSPPSSSTPPPPLPKQRKTFYTLIGVPSSSSTHKFDRAHLWVTSPLFRNPFIFGGLRILVALYLLVTAIIFLVDYAKDGEGDSYLSFFTNLCYIGLIAYFFASGVQTLSYALRWRRNGAGAGYALQSWPRPLQALHVALYSTIVTFPFIVTAVYWALIGGAEVFEQPKRAWQGTSVHILNSILAASELVFSNSPAPPFIALPLTILCLAAYLGIAYITYATHQFYTYAFLDPTKTGSLLAAYICGILAGQCILFTLVHYIARLRHRIALAHRRVISFEKYPASSASRKGSRERMRDEEELVEGESPSTRRQKGVVGEGVMGERAVASPPPRTSGTAEGRESAYGLAYGGEDLDQLEGEWEDVQHPNTSRPELAAPRS